jgi:hypothetical protein
MRPIEPGVLELSGTIVEMHAIRLEQRPLVFVVPTERGAWSWPIVGALDITGASCTARLGPKER